MAPEERKLKFLYIDRDILTNGIIATMDSIKTNDNKAEIEALSRLVTDLKVVCEKIGKLEQLTIKG